MVAWALLCLIVISVNLSLGQLSHIERDSNYPNHYHRESHNQDLLCEQYSRQLKNLLEALLDAIERDEHLSSHPDLWNILHKYINHVEPNNAKAVPYKLPILKQKFVDDNFVEEGSEDDLPPTNEVVAEIFKDIRLLFWRKDQRRVPVGRIEDILLTRLRPFIMFPIVKPCRKENVDTMLNFVRSAYLRYLETPCYDNAARSGDEDDNHEDRLLQEFLKDYVWHKKAKLRVKRPQPKSCKTRAFDYFLESIKIIVQLFIKNYDCHPKDDYNAPPIKGFHDVYSETDYTSKTPLNEYTRLDLMQPFRTLHGTAQKDMSYNYNSNTGNNVNNRFEVYNHETGKNIPSSKDSVLIGPVRDDDKLRNTGNKVHLTDSGYGDMFYPYYHTASQNRDQRTKNPSILLGPLREDDEWNNKGNNVHLTNGGYGDEYSTLNNQNGNSNSATGVPNLIDFYGSIYGGAGNPSEAKKVRYIDPAKHAKPGSLNPFNLKGYLDNKINLNPYNNGDTKISEPENVVSGLENFQNSDPFSQFDSLINKPSIELPSFDQSSNKTNVEVFYVVRHPQVLIYNPQFVIKQKMSYETYLNNLKEIFNSKNFGATNKIQLLKVLKRTPNGELVQIFQSKDENQSLIVKDANIVNNMIREEAKAKEEENKQLRSKSAELRIESNTEQAIQVPVKLEEEKIIAKNKAANVTDNIKKEISKTVKVKVAKPSTTTVRNISFGLKSSKEKTNGFVDETRSSKEGENKKEKRSSGKTKKEIHLYNTTSFNDIVKNYKED